MASSAATTSTPVRLPFITLDVFTTTRFKGNPLAVVTIPANLATPPTQEQKQSIAREFNLSETVFVHEVDPATTSEEDAQQRKIDIFLVNREVPFAGHPVIGAAVSLLPLGVRTIVTKAGPISITQTSPCAVKAQIPHDVRIHAKCLRDVVDQSQLDLSPDTALRQIELGAPLVSIVNGMTFQLVELPTLEQLARARASRTPLPTDILDEGWRDSFMARYSFVHTGTRGDIVTLRTRLVYPASESPATGSAASALCCYLSLMSNSADKLTSYEVTQGVEMGRESTMNISVIVKDGMIGGVTIEGTATQVMDGFITL